MHEWSLKIFPNSALDFEIKYPQIDQEIESGKNEIYLEGGGGMLASLKWKCMMG